MSYINAKNVLPKELLEKLQDYAEGECLYIPRREEEKKPWGTDTSTRKELSNRNSLIFCEYLSGVSTELLSEKYFLSCKSIQRIILNEKRALYNEPESA